MFKLVSVTTSSKKKTTNQAFHARCYSDCSVYQILLPKRHFEFSFV